MNLLQIWLQTLVSILQSLNRSGFFALRAIVSSGLSMRAHSDEWLPHEAYVMHQFLSLGKQKQKKTRKNTVLLRLHDNSVSMVTFNTLPLPFCYLMLSTALIHYFQLAMGRNSYNALSEMNWMFLFFANITSLAAEDVMPLISRPAGNVHRTRQCQPRTHGRATIQPVSTRITPLWMY